MKMGRLIAILTALLQKDRISARWLAEKFDVSIRTIYRDIQTLETAGIPIVTHTGINGGISIIEQYKIDKRLFTHDDITMLLTSLQSISSTIPNAKINQTLEKIKSLVPKEHNKSIELTSKQLYIDMTPWFQNSMITANFNALKQAVEDQIVLCFDYTGRNKQEERRKVEPHQLILKESNWYLRAYCQEKQAFRIFKLARIRHIEIQNETFETRPFDSKMTDFKEWRNDRLITVELIINESLRERALDYCDENSMITMDNGKIHLSLPFVESDIGYGVLLGMGDQCEIISPSSIREEFIRRVALISGVYQNKEL